MLWTFRWASFCIEIDLSRQSLQHEPPLGNTEAVVSLEQEPAPPRVDTFVILAIKE